MKNQSLKNKKLALLHLPAKPHQTSPNQPLAARLAMARHTRWASSLQRPCCASDAKSGAAQGSRCSGNWPESFFSKASSKGRSSERSRFPYLKHITSKRGFSIIQQTFKNNSNNHHHNHNQHTPKHITSPASSSSPAPPRPPSAAKRRIVKGSCGPLKTCERGRFTGLPKLGFAAKAYINKILEHIPWKAPI